MKLVFSLRFAALALLAALSVTALVACGSDSKDDEESSSSSSGSTGARAGSKKLSDCEYATAFTESALGNS
jgi:hypothetical protein